MPRTELYNKDTTVSIFTRPIFKKRLSSRGQGVTWDATKANCLADEWIIQESLDIDEELRVYVVKGKVCPIAAVRQNMVEGTAAQAMNSRALSKDEHAFAAKIAAKCTDLDLLGLDIAMTSAERPYLMEVNRSPGFAKLYELTGINIANELYAGTSTQTSL